jgi:hypothetical protein
MGEVQEGVWFTAGLIRKYSNIHTNYAITRRKPDYIRLCLLTDLMAFVVKETIAAPNSHRLFQ